MRVPFGDIRERLSAAKIFFTPSGMDRLKDQDIISFSDDCEIEPYAAFLGGNNLFSMGAFSYSWSQLPLNASVGRYCSIAKGLKILGVRHPMEWITTSSFTYDHNFIIYKDLVDAEGSSFKTKRRPSQSDHVVIGHDVWIGADVTLKPGITIGNGSVIAASSMVVKDVPPYSVVGGNPAKVIKSRFDVTTINILSSVEWWNYKFTDFAGMDFDSPLVFSENLKTAIKEGRVSRFFPEPLCVKKAM